MYYCTMISTTLSQSSLKLPATLQITREAPCNHSVLLHGSRCLHVISLNNERNYILCLCYQRLAKKYLEHKALPLAVVKQFTKNNHCWALLYRGTKLAVLFVKVPVPEYRGKDIGTLFAFLKIVTHTIRNQHFDSDTLKELFTARSYRVPTFDYDSERRKSICTKGSLINCRRARNFASNKSLI